MPPKHFYSNFMKTFIRIYQISNTFIISHSLCFLYLNLDNGYTVPPGGGSSTVPVGTYEPLMTLVRVGFLFYFRYLFGYLFADFGIQSGVILKLWVRQLSCSIFVFVSHTVAGHMSIVTSLGGTIFYSEYDSWWSWPF